MFNLNKTLLRIVTRYDNMYAYDVEVEKIGTGNPLNTSYALKGGFAANLLIQLSSYLNFSYDFVLDSNKTLIYRFEEASNLSIDLFAASYALTKQRTVVADPTFPITNTRIKVFFNHAFEESMQDFILAPFQTNVWCMLGATVLALSVAIEITSVFNDGNNLGNSAFQILTLMIQKDGRIPFASLPSRVILWTTFFTSFVLYGTYSGTIISFCSDVKWHSFTTA